MQKLLVGCLAALILVGCSGGEGVSGKDSVASEMQKAGVTSAPDGTSKDHSDKMKVNPGAGAGAASAAPAQEPQ